MSIRRTILLLSTIVISHGKITPIPDGLLVTQSKDVYAVGSQYEILITIEPPTWPKVFDDYILKLMTYIRNLSRTVSLTSHDHKLWLRRLGGMTSVKRKYLIRSKRALLGIVGKISKTLFGTATTEDVERIAEVLRTSVQDQDKLFTRVNSLLTIVNQSNSDITLNRNRLLLVRSHLEEVTSRYNGLIASYNNLTLTIDGLRTNYMIEHMVQAIERHADVIYQQMDNFHTQKLALEDERLTEDLLSEQALTDILQEAETSHTRMVSPIQWYYEYSTVQPIWTKQTLVYKVLLPLVIPQTFTMYNFHVFPVLNDQGTIVTKMNVVKGLAIDTMTGYMMQPYECKGHAPLVCKNNIKYKAGHECEYAMLHTKGSNFSQCNADVKVGNFDSTVESFHNEGYVLSSKGEAITTRCPHKMSVEEIVSAGVYILHVPDLCVLSGPTWSVSKIKKVFKKVRIAATKVPIPFLNIVNFATKHVEMMKDDVSKWNKLGQVHTINLQPLVHEDYNLYRLNRFISEMSDADIGYTVAILFLYILLIIYVCYKCKLYYARYMLRKLTKKSLNEPDEQIELKVINEPTPVNDKNDLDVYRDETGKINFEKVPLQRPTTFRFSPASKYIYPKLPTSPPENE
jgi:hypothetical protein